MNRFVSVKFLSLKGLGKPEYTGVGDFKESKLVCVWGAGDEAWW